MGQQNTNPATIQQRLDALIIALQYAPISQKPPIQKRIDSLLIAIEYAA